VSSLLISQSGGPVTADSGGTSQGNNNAGSNSDDLQEEYDAVQASDRAGAAILTILVIVSACGMFGWMSFGE
jgi:mannan endo-1,6-alpha-mannosidase